MMNTISFIKMSYSSPDSSFLKWGAPQEAEGEREKVVSKLQVGDLYLHHGCKPLLATLEHPGSPPFICYLVLAVGMCLVESNSRAVNSGPSEPPSATQWWLTAPFYSTYDSLTERQWYSKNLLSRLPAWFISPWILTQNKNSPGIGTMWHNANVLIKLQRCMGQMKSKGNVMVDSQSPSPSNISSCMC